MPAIFNRLPVVLLCLLAGCPSTDHSASGSVVVTADDSTLEAFDETTQLHAAEFSGQGKPLPSDGFAWTSSDPGIASVDANGLVTAHGNGTAVIRAVSERGFAGTTEIVVEQVPVALLITPEDWPSAEVWIGARRQFAAEAQDANGYPVAGVGVTWSTSNDNVVDIDADGFATAMDAGNNVQVTAVAGALSDSLLVTVVKDGSLGPGLMYTIWYPRSDDAPAVLADGKIFVPDEIVSSVSRTNPTPPWPHNRPTVHKFQWEGDRIGILTDVADGSGTFRVRDRVGEWINLAIADAVDFQLEGNLIGVLLRGGRLLVKDSSAAHQGSWTEVVPSGAAEFQLHESRIGVVMENGELRVKVGLDEFPGTWTTLVPAGDAPRFQLADTQTAVLHADGRLRVRDEILGLWIDIASHVVDFQFHFNRIAWVDDIGVFRVQLGVAGTPVVLSNEPVAQFQLEGNRIGMRLQSGPFRVRDGINGEWIEMAAGDVREFQLQETLIGMIRDSDGALLVKDDHDDPSWATSTSHGASVTQFRVVVDVPSPPFHTTPATYAEEQARCAAIGEDAPPEDNDCYTVPNFEIPVAFYGMFCGMERPHDFGAAINAGAIDAFDNLCWHHDMVSSWYPETPNDASDAGGACIVRYGLRHGRLTQDGVVLTHGYDDSQGWEDGWANAGMVNLKDALDDYFAYTIVCTEGMLTDFSLATASQH